MAGNLCINRYTLCKYDIFTGCERDSYFKKSLSLLEDSSSDSEKFLLQCRVEQEKYDEFWPASSLTPCYNYYNKEFEVHDYSTSILPKELQNSYSALKCSADGNCLYRYDTTLV